MYLAVGRSTGVTCLANFLGVRGQVKAHKRVHQPASRSQLPNISIAHGQSILPGQPAVHIQHRPVCGGTCGQPTCGYASSVMLWYEFASYVRRAPEVHLAGSMSPAATPALAHAKQCRAVAAYRRGPLVTSFSHSLCLLNQRPQVAG
jgi:hypothetical protein